jgi:hypothetical protein
VSEETELCRSQQDREPLKQQAAGLTERSYRPSQASLIPQSYPFARLAKNQPSGSRQSVETSSNYAVGLLARFLTFFIDSEVAT